MHIVSRTILKSRDFKQYCLIMLIEEEKKEKKTKVK